MNGDGTGLERVLQIGRRGSGDGSVDVVGSGYLVAPDLVLTCAHLFMGHDGGWCVRRERGHEWTELRPVPHARYAGRDSAEYDIALGVVLGVPPAVGGQGVSLRALRRGLRHIPFVAAGFPDFAVNGGRSWRHQFRGFIELGSLGGHRLGLTLNHGPEIGRLLSESRGKRHWDWRIGESHWAGVSGAAVLTEEDDVVGTVAQYVMESGTAVAVSVTSLAEDPELIRLLDDRGLRVTKMEVNGVWRVVPGAAVPHETYAADLARHDSFLLPERLPFVRPEPNAVALPERIVEQLAVDAHGVLVTGVAGTGKSRICLESAALAHRRGWTVLHLRTADGLTTERVLDVALRAGGDHVLLVVDDLPDDAVLDPSAIPRELADRGVGGRTPRVAVLASAGPVTFERLSRRSVAQRFAPAPVPVTQRYREEVRDRIVAELVPDPVRNKEPQAGAVAALCGTRPGLAVLIAEALETRGRRLVIPWQSRLPGHPLALWLLTHLGADGLHRPSGGVAGEDRPGPLLLAGTAALAACPQPRRAVEAAVGGALSRLSAVEPSAEAVVDELLGRGWLEVRDGLLHSLHGLVTQELLRHCLLTPSGAGTHAETGRALLDAALTGPVTLGRFVRALRTLCTDYPELPGETGRILPSLLERLCGSWLADRAEQVGSQTVDETLYSLLEGPPWRAATLDAWDAVSGPCLRAAEAEERAHSVLRRILTIRDPGAPRSTNHSPRPVAASTLDWLQRHPDHTAAPEVLGTLLTCLSPQAAERAECTEMALTWLFEHSSWPKASFLLAEMLRADLSADDTARVTVRALKWLDHHGNAAQASFVLRPLLEHPSLPTGMRAQAAERALAWLRRNDTYGNAPFVFRGLLVATGVRPEHFRAAVPHVLNWFAQHGQNPTAFLVAKELFKEERPGGPPTETVLDWLTAHDAGLESHDLLMSLLRVDERHITRAQAQRAITHGLTWLGRHGTRRRAKDVIDALLARGERRTSEDGNRLRDRKEFTWQQADETLRHAADWMDSHGTGSLSPKVLGGMLGFRHGGPEQGRRIAAHAMSWLDAQPENAARPEERRAYRNVLTTLIRRGLLSEEQALGALARADRWLEQTGETPESRFCAGVFRLLKRYPAPDAEREELRARLVDTILHRTCRTTPVGGQEQEDLSQLTLRLGIDAVKFLLGVRGLAPERRERIVPAVLDWLENHVEHERADFVLVPLLKMEGLRKGHAVRAVDFALDWLDYWCTYDKASEVKQGPTKVLAALVRRPEVIGDELHTAAELANKWMSIWFNQTSGANPALLSALLSRGDLPPTIMATVLQRALAWRGREIVLQPADDGDMDPEEDEEDDGEREEQEELGELGEQEDPGGTASGCEPSTPTLSALEEHAFTWLDTHRHRREAGRVIGHLASRLLKAVPENTDAVERVLRFALEWLAEYREEAEAYHPLMPLLDHHARLGERARDCLTVALHWLELHRERRSARHVLRHAADHPDLTPDEQQHVVRYAFAWVDGHRARTSYVKASYILRPLAQVNYLDADQVRGLADRLLDWSGAMVQRLKSMQKNGKLNLRGAERPELRFALQPLLARRDLPPPYMARALAAAFAAERAPGLPPTFAWKLPGPDGQAGEAAEPFTSLPQFALSTLESLENAEAGLGAEAAEAIAELLRWDGDDARRATGLALHWLDTHVRTAPAGDICSRLLQNLQRLTLDDRQRATAVHHSLTWLAAHPDAHQGGHVLEHLLGTVPPSGEVTRRALTWLERHAQSATAPCVLHPLLRREDLAPEQRAAAVRHGYPLIRSRWKAGWSSRRRRKW
ncbi:hypothetical protein ACWCPL_38350, partial [Streptomyces sp. NPDC001948]